MNSSPIKLVLLFCIGVLAIGWLLFGRRKQRAGWLAAEDAVSRRTIVALVLLGLALRAAFAAIVLQIGDQSFDAFTEPDTESYLRWHETRTPVLPVLLAAAEWCFGSVEWSWCLGQIAAGTATVWTTIRIAERLRGDRRNTIVAGVLMATDPLSIVYCARFASETLFTLLVALWLLAVLGWFQKGDAARAGTAGFLVAAAALVRPVAGYLPAVSTLLMALPVRGAGTIAGPRWRTLVVYFLASAGPLVGWCACNHARLDYFGLSPIAEVNLYYYHAAAAVARDEGRSYYEVQREWRYHSPERVMANRRESRGDVYRAIGLKGRHLIRRHWRAALANHFAGCARLMFDPGSVELLRSLGQYPRQGLLLGHAVDKGIVRAFAEVRKQSPSLAIATIPLAAQTFAIWLLATIGVARLARRSPHATIFLVVTLVYFVLISGGPAALGRFRVPVVPLLCVLAAEGMFGGARMNAKLVGPSPDTPRDGIAPAPKS